ncbi:hypothetical protein ACFL2T_06680 [Elusimicrobiota bacterium]
MTRRILEATIILAVAFPAVALGAVAEPLKPRPRFKTLNIPGETLMAPPGKPSPVPSVLPKVILIEIHARHHGLATSCKFKVLNATQSNYVTRDTKKGLNFIANVLPVIIPNQNAIDLQIQVEISAFGGKNNTFQVQTEIVVIQGVKTVVVDSPDAEVLLTVQEAPFADEEEEDEEEKQ